LFEPLRTIKPKISSKRTSWGKECISTVYASAITGGAKYYFDVDSILQRLEQRPLHPEEARGPRYHPSLV